jgi:hypothetical protein
MAQRHIVYLKRSAADVTPQQLLKAIRDVEWDLVAEACKVPRKWISEADENMRITRVGRSRKFRRYQLHYRAGDQRPVDLERWESEDMAKGVIQELMDDMRPSETNDKARRFLAGCVDTVSGSYGSALPGESMAPILASQACLWLAQQFDGIIRDPRGNWYEPLNDLELKPL